MMNRKENLLGGASALANADGLDRATSPVGKAGKIKVGILTYHDGPNHGAFLQAWSTLRVLQQGGHNSVILNYKNPRHQQMEGLTSILRQSNPLAVWEAFRKRQAFQRAHREFGMGPRLRTAAEIRAQELDAIVIGSDVVWNYGIFGYDPVFFGRVDVPKKIAYAASFGAVARGSDHPAAMRDDLASFDEISVRDENSKAIVADQIGRDAAVTVDPTLLYGFAEELHRVKPRGNRAAVVYSYRHPQSAIDLFRNWARDHGTSVVCVGYPPPFRSRRSYDRIDTSLGPFEWVRMMSDAGAVMTSTFHGVVFSLKYEKQFLYVTNDKAHNRVASLLTALGINHDLKPGCQDRPIWFSPDYDMVRENLATLADASKRWLDTALNGPQVGKCSRSLSPLPPVAESSGN